MVNNIKISSKVNKSSQVNLNKVIKEKLKNYEKDLKKAFFNELAILLKSPETAEPYIAETLKILNEMQAYYWGAGLAAQEDPTRLGLPEHQAAVRQEIYLNFQKAQINAESGEIKITLLSDAFMGIGSDDGKRRGPGIPWLGYFVTGSLQTDLFWINKEVYAILKPEDAGRSLGRFGVGELWHFTTEGQQILKARLNNSKYTLQELKHPQSGKQGKNWFEDVWNKISLINLLQDKALNRAQQKVKLNLTLNG